MVQRWPQGKEKGMRKFPVTGFQRKRHGRIWKGAPGALKPWLHFLMKWHVGCCKVVGTGSKILVMHVSCWCLLALVVVVLVVVGGCAQKGYMIVVGTRAYLFLSFPITS